jgi:hypothetical protein
MELTSDAQQGGGKGGQGALGVFGDDPERQIAEQQLEQPR